MFSTKVSSSHRSNSFLSLYSLFCLQFYSVSSFRLGSSSYCSTVCDAISFFCCYYWFYFHLLHLACRVTTQYFALLLDILLKYKRQTTFEERPTFTSYKYYYLFYLFGISCSSFSSTCHLEEIGDRQFEEGVRSQEPEARRHVASQEPGARSQET